MRLLRERGDKVEHPIATADAGSAGNFSRHLLVSRPGIDARPWAPGSPGGVASHRLNEVSSVGFSALACRKTDGHVFRKAFSAHPADVRIRNGEPRRNGYVRGPSEGTPRCARETERHRA